MGSTEFYGGSLNRQTWTVLVTDGWRSGKFAGYSISDEVFEALIDAGVETVVFVDPNRGRCTSTIEDWQDYSVRDDDSLHLRQSWMSYG